MQWVNKAILALAVQLVLAGAGLVLGLDPGLILKLTFGASALLAIVYFLPAVPHDNIRNMVDGHSRFSYRDVYGTSMAITIIVGFTVVAWTLIGGRLTDRAWSTGQFGEPPDNRFVAVSEVQPLGDAPVGYLVEWGVRLTDSNGVLATLEFDGPVEQRWEWYDQPGLTQPRTFQEAREPQRSLVRYNQISGECCVGAKVDRWDLSDTRSFYVYVESEVARAVIDCYLGDFGEPGHFERECNGGNVRLALGLIQ